MAKHKHASQYRRSMRKRLGERKQFGPGEQHERYVIQVTRKIHTLEAKRRLLRKQLAELDREVKVQRRALKVRLQERVDEATSTEHDQIRNRRSAVDAMSEDTDATEETS